jgi:hypothetical protein
MVQIVQISALCAPCAPWAPCIHTRTLAKIHQNTCENTPENHLQLCALCAPCASRCTSEPLILDGASTCTLHIYVCFCASCAPSAPCTLYGHIFLKMHQSVHSADLRTLCTLCILCTLCTPEPLFLEGDQSAHVSKLCTFVHLVHPVHLVYILFRKSTRVHNPQICALRAFCALCALISIFSAQDLVRILCNVHFYVPFYVCFGDRVPLHSLHCKI